MIRRKPTLVLANGEQFYTHTYRHAGASVVFNLEGRVIYLKRRQTLDITGTHREINHVLGMIYEQLSA